MTLPRQKKKRESGGGREGAQEKGPEGKGRGTGTKIGNIDSPARRRHN